jgi:predicted ATPase/DNA-binding SARP family transcriptional activator
VLALRTFGGLSIEQDGAAGTGAATRAKTLGLLALLAAAGKKGVRRDKLIGYLWPDADLAHGRHLLKQACYALRHDLRAPDLLLGRAELRLNPAVVSSDIQAFEEAVQRGDLAQAVALHAGPFLDGVYVDEAGEFEHWVDDQRRRLIRHVCAALETLATEAGRCGEHRAAAEWWRRLAALEPLSSRAAVGVMTALAALGESAEALRYGQVYEAFVRQELGAAPEPAVGAVLGRLRLEPTAAEGVSPEDLRLATVSGDRRRTVGYEHERAALRTGFQAAVAGRGQMLCVAGEPGSGKTTLVEDFLGEVIASGRPCHVARGRCSERLAGSGAYLPLLDALEGLLRADARGVVARLLADLAPNWNVQIAPALQPAGLQATTAVQAASQERLKRELNAFLREVCRLRPLVLFLDDVHWVDASTIDVLGYVANQMGTAQMVILTAYRPSELHLAKHPFGPLKLDLQSRGLCREVSLQLLTPADIEQFLGLEFPGNQFPAAFGQFIHAKTEGNPLFMVDLLRYLRVKQVIVAKNGGWTLGEALPDLEQELPESVRSMIERKIEQLDEPDRELLAMAGVQGYECDAPILAEMLGTDAAAVEERLDALERVHGFVRRLREHQFPDGTLAARYRFVHVLYQNALYARLTPTRRAALSRTVAEALLGHYREQSAEVAAELALLFEAARDVARAVEYFALAAERAAQIFANQEAIALARRGLGQLAKLPDTRERPQQELRLQVTLAFSLLCTRGYAAPETGANMARARRLCETLGEAAQLQPVRMGLWTYYITTGDMKAAREAAEQLLTMAGKLNDPALRLGAHAALGITLRQQGELVAGRRHCEEASRHYDVAEHQRYVRLYRFDPGIYAESIMVGALWQLGFPDQARRKSTETLALARALSSPLSLAFCHCLVIFLHQFLREPAKAREIGEACIALCNEHGIELERAWIECTYGWAIAELGQVDEGISLILRCLETQRVLGNEVARPQSQAVLAETLWHAGRAPEALQAVEDGLAVSSRNGDTYYDAGLWRLKGQLLEIQDKAAEAESCFHHAIAVARQQAAKSFELRAGTSLASLWQKQGKRREAQHLLNGIYGWFTEGFDTPDLIEARSLLAELT